MPGDSRRILDERGGNAPGEKIDHERTRQRAAERGGRRHGSLVRAAAGTQCLLTRAVELPVALAAVLVAVDRRQITPDAQQVRIALGSEGREDLPVRLRRGRLQ